MFRKMLCGLGLGNAAVATDSEIDERKCLPNLTPGATCTAVIFVGGIWQSQTPVQCTSAMRRILLAYRNSATENAWFSPPLVVVTSCCKFVFGVDPEGIVAESNDRRETRVGHWELLGLVRTARMELRRLCKKRIDIYFINTEGEFAACLVTACRYICCQLSGNPTRVLVEDEVLIHPPYIYFPRLVKVPQSNAFKGVGITKEKSYVVTGGTGALGLLVAQWLLRLGAGYVALLSRSGKPSVRSGTHSDALRSIEDAISVHRASFIPCDVSNAEAVFKALAGINCIKIVGGIFHCAGHPGKPTLELCEEQVIAEVYAAKITGTWNIQNACEALQLEKGLDHFVLFSSISALPGNDGFPVYAAANAFLDGFAHWRRSRGWTAQSIQWGPWGDSGMAARNSSVLRAMDARGIRPVSDSEGVDQLRQILESTRGACVCALHVNWACYARGFGECLPPALCKVLPTAESFVDRRGDSRQLTREAIAMAVLSLAQSLTSQPVDVCEETRVEQLGLDSLGAVELRNALQDKLSVPLPASLLLEHSTLRNVIESLVDDYGCRMPETIIRCEGTKGDGITRSTGFAVIGMSCRLPGNSNSPSEFWEMMMRETDCVQEIPWQRFNIHPFYDADLSENKCYVKEAALLDNAHLFDNVFFGMSQLQARNIDPQQRVILEVAYEALHDAEYSRHELEGQDIGVFCATYTNDYQTTSLCKGENGILAIGDGINASVPNLGEAAGYPEPGGLMCLIPNRISYYFGLVGPSVGIDTACASGLVALDAATAKLKLKCCSKALVGAVSLILSPCLFIGGSKARQFSKCGRCRTFDASADGLVRGEGAAAIVIAPLASAHAERKFVHGVIRGTAVAHYGHGARLTAPNTRALCNVLKMALQDGNIRQQDVLCYEAHGTATVLGDIVEMRAIQNVFGKERSPMSPLYVGTAHNNIGHLDSAASLVALLKVILTLQRKVVPPNIQFAKLHPELSFVDTTQIIYTRVAQNIQLRDKDQRICGANLAYGLGGTVAAAVTQEGDNPVNRKPVSTTYMIGSRLLCY